MKYSVRKANINDWEFVKELLLDICAIHKEFRPDLFLLGGLKFSKTQFEETLDSDEKFVHICVSENGERLAYLFSKLNIIKNNDMRTDRRILYLDDLCVKSDWRGKGVGSEMMEFAKKFAYELNCDSIELNAWAQNTSAIKLYEKLGYSVQRSFFELILK